MKENKTNIIKNKIIENINELDIASFLKEEVIALLKYLHFYKLNNILSHLEDFKEYLIFLDKQNTRQLQLLTKKIERQKKDFSETDSSYEYFISKNGLKKIGKNLMGELFSQNNYISKEIQVEISGMKGLLLLTADEFCHSSITRISINKEILKKNEIK